MDSKPPIVGVVMPVRNGEITIKDAILSILTQTLADLELIVIDDNSTDGTRQILEDLCSKDYRIRVFASEGTGISAARNTGLKHVRAEFYACMDADDIAQPTRLEKQVNAFLARADLVLLGSFCSTFHGNPGLEEKVPLPTGNKKLQVEIQFDPTFFHPSIMARTEHVRKVGGYRCAFDGAEDHDLYLRLANVGDIDILPEYLLSYRLHQAQITQTKKARSRVASLAAVRANELSLTDEDLMLLTSIDELAYDRLESMCAKKGRLSKRQVTQAVRTFPALAARQYDQPKLTGLRRKWMAKLLLSCDFLAAIRFLKRTTGLRYQS
ncbi:UDP-Glc:alpha-D-GlcNAc-diphosphoundecaprenol beta-1,3-glucosyltransferase WfgD [Pseudovibrio sp. W64]|uniref:glycosyltransferase family 2 protein n=1 Tax=Pseudovibrio sp. W64 TaxID=1735583 RepID=UPI0007AE3A64|nr:glycosyltransferase [Pseudovibrio sp. W64]KZK87649.1 UDP-Glc:alpha-D-GlcNAc-diphosphoundecaprenol beta-1,3-glucosyltransferase WfgD [Pseudovibrio sp. W64]